MKTSLKDRIVAAIILAITIFIFMAIFYAATGHENWFNSALNGAVTWALGCFVARTIANTGEKVWKRLLLEALLIGIASLVLAVLIKNLDEFGQVCLQLVLPFTVATLVNSVSFAKK